MTRQEAMRITQRKWAENPRHGHGRRGLSSPTYNSWRGMIGRCRDKSNASYRRYGARGITVCDRWTKFDNFLADMGLRPPGMTLDRIDNDGNYEPSNCRWADKQTQSRDRRPLTQEHRAKLRVAGLAREARKRVQRGIC